MKLKFFLFLFCCALLNCSDDMNVVYSQITTLEPLILFDVAGTLITQDKERWEKVKHLQESNPELDVHDFKLKWFFIQKTQCDLTDIIWDLQLKFKVLCLTQCSNLKTFYKIYQTDYIGLDFNKSYPNLPFMNLNCDNGPALFSNGILYCGKNTKGNVLLAFVNRSKVAPTQIIFIDDKMKHIESVSKCAFDLNIPFTGILYTKVNNSLKIKSIFTGLKNKLIEVTN